jgi:CheY-like chemotaxis protein
MLIAEDREADIQLLKLAFSRAKSQARLHFVRDGQEAIHYLNGEGQFADRAQHPIPAMLLLDLNMPIIDGFSVLEWLRSRKDSLSRLPVVVFTSSAEPKDINRSYDLGANSYLVKPLTPNKLTEIVHYLDAYWYRLNQRPDCVTEYLAGTF